jgi:putative nucleotidyltransferase with HDIG domain
MSPGRKHSRSTVRLRYLVRELSRQGRTGGFLEIYRIVLLVIAAVAIDFAFPMSSTPDLPPIQAEVVASEDVIAPVTFPVYKSVAELTQERNEAASAVSPIFVFRPEISDSSVVSADAFFAAIDEAVADATQDIERQTAVLEVLDRYAIPVSEDQASVLAAPVTRSAFASAMGRAFRGLLPDGVASNRDLGSVAAGSIILRRDTVETLVARESLPTLQQFWEEALALAPSEISGDARQVYQTLLIHFSGPTIVPDRQATEAAQDQARQAVNRVKYEVLEGEFIVRAHERVGQEEVDRLNALAAHLGQSDGIAWDARFGGVLFNLLLLVIFGLVLRYFRAEIYDSTPSVTLIWILLLAVAGGAALIVRSGWSPLLIPIAFAALTIATLYDGLLALIAVFVLVGLIMARPPLSGMTAIYPAIVGGAAAALSGRVVRRRAHTWAFAAVIALAYVLAVSSLGLITRQGFGWVVQGAFWGTLNAIGCTLLATGILPLAESFTRITTDQTLLEFADLNRPALRRLSLEAPGTYAHSINVANLAEAAARAIDADALLVRVGVYYHDIGKVKKPQFFVENQPRGRNPHDKLKPSTSASIVREHVKDGLELAEEERLPDQVKAFISEHHGTQRISFFWEKAMELEPDAELDPNDFRYPGPMPQSKETAIALLADSVESAARVLQDPTPESIKELVDRIVTYKMDEGQLGETPLTLQDVTGIKEQFVKVLSSMYHHRLDYPLQNQQSPRSVDSPVPGAQ